MDRIESGRLMKPDYTTARVPGPPSRSGPAGIGIPDRAPIERAIILLYSVRVTGNSE